MTLELKLALLKIQENQKMKELEILELNCNHEILVETISKNSFAETKQLYCLFCGAINPYTRKYITWELIEKYKNSTIIKMENYPLLLKSYNKRKMEKLYLELRKKFPKDTEAQIANKMMERLQVENEKRE
jgi:hypothetical protein